MTDFDKSCCFSGHRKIDPPHLNEIVKKLGLEIEWMISHGIEDFYAGGALGFDTIAALEVLWHKKQGCNVRLHLMLPCPEQASRWSDRDISIYNDILKNADTVTVLSDKYNRGVMFKRNRAMVEACKYCLCYFAHPEDIFAQKSKGGTLYTIK